MKYDPAETLHCHALVEEFVKAVGCSDYETAKNTLNNITKGAEADFDRFLSDPASPDYETHRHRIKTLLANAFVVCEASLEAYCPKNSEMAEFVKNQKESSRVLKL